MTAQEIQTLVRYSGWASRLLLDAAAKLDPADLNRGVGVSHESIFRTLAHIYWADAVWHQRIVNASLSVAEVNDLSQLNEHWRSLQHQWEGWADSLSDQDSAREIPYKSLNGQVMGNALWHLLIHVTNHATLHRGQAVAMIRQLGIEPPHTDFIYYLREVAAKG